MILPGHISGSYLTTRAVLSYFHPALFSSQLNILLLIGIIAGELPDIDLIGFYYEQKLKRPKINNHRSYITHAPLFWLAISLIIAFVGFIFNSTLTQYLALVLLTGTWTHLILDSIEYGVMWLWPFSTKHFSLIKHVPKEHVTARAGTFASHWQYVKSAYLRTVTMWVEVVVTVVAVLTFFGM